MSLEFHAFTCPNCEGHEFTTNINVTPWTVLCGDCKFVWDYNLVVKQPPDPPSKDDKIMQSFNCAPRDDDPVNHPPHYTQHPSGVECITITEHMNFNVGNAVKYLWRSDLKNGIEDLEKAQWYVAREIERRTK